MVSLDFDKYKISRTAIIIILSTLVFLVSLDSPSSHGHIPDSEERIVNNHVIRFKSYPNPIKEGEHVQLFFSVHDLEGRDMGYGTVRVFIIQDNKIIHNYSEKRYYLGDFSVEYSVESKGDLIIVIEFLDEDLVAEFPLIVTPYNSNFHTAYTIFFIIILLIGGVVFIYLVRDRKSFRLMESERDKSRPISIFTKIATSNHFLKSIFFVSNGILLTLLMLSPWAEFMEDRNLTFHMIIEHLGFVTGALFISFGSENIILGLVNIQKRSSNKFLLSTYSQLVLINNRINKHGRISIPISIVLLIYWHIPDNFRRAVLDDQTHSIMHLSLIIIGILVYLNLKVVSKTEATIHGILLGQAMLVWGIIMMISQINIYFPYSFYQQGETGLIMAAPHPFIVAILVVYVLSRYLDRE